jgi:ribonuclease P protein component
MNGLPRIHKLVTQAEYKALFDQSRRVNGRVLTILYIKNNKLYGRMGLIVGKRVAKKAVSRNKIKRVIRESFRSCKKKLAGIDMIVIARKQCDKLSKQKLREGIDKLWEKLLMSQSNVLS